MALFFRSFDIAALRLFVFLLFFMVGLLTEKNAYGNRIQSVNLETADRKRYLALMLLNLARERSNGDINLISMGHRSGMNALYLTIPWNYVYYESPTESPDWSKYDEQIETATRLGMKVAIRIHLGRHNSRIKGFWDLKDSPHDGRNLPLLSGYGDTHFRFDYDPALQKAIAFVKEVVKRYQFLQDQKSLLFISVTNTTEQEGGFNTSTYNEGKQVSALFDYSPEVVTGFRSWLQTNYGRIERLNAKWGTSYKSFQDAGPPYANWEPSESFTSRFGKDWYIYRHLHLKTFVEKMISAVKSVDPAIKYMADYGSVFDQASAVRGTLGFKDLNKKADGVKVNDDLSRTDHRFSVDILRSQLPASFLVANELFHADWALSSELTKQIDENFQSGADIVAVVPTAASATKDYEPYLKDASSRWLGTPIPPIVYRDTVSYLLSEAVDKGAATKVVYKAYSEKAYADPKNPRPVYIKLIEDLFSEDYWLNASNKKPTVTVPLEPQTIPVSRSYKFAVPQNLFADSDGQITSTEVSNLPGWLAYKDGTLTGTPPVTGAFQITVTGVDDEGGKVSTPLVINVVVPVIKFELIAGASDKRLVTALNGGEMLPYSSIPSLINITATSNFDFETIDFDLKGPYGKTRTSSTPPHSLIESIYGFSPSVGRYKLTALTRSAGIVTASKTVEFVISYGDASDIAKHVVPLQFYPNPVESVINIKIPDDTAPKELEFILIHTSGRAVALRAPHVTIGDKLANIDLTGAGVQEGTYIIQLRKGQTVLSQFRLVKY